MVDAEAGPRFGDDDGVAGVAGIKADLDGKVNADVADVLGERANVLGAFVGDAGDAIAVDEGVGGGVFGFAGPVGLGDAAIDDATGGGEVVAAFALELFLVGLDAMQAVPGDAGHGCDPEAEDRECTRRSQDGWDGRRDNKKHGG